MANLIANFNTDIRKVDQEEVTKLYLYNREWSTLVDVWILWDEFLVAGVRLNFCVKTKRIRKKLKKNLENRGVRCSLIRIRCQAHWELSWQNRTNIWQKWSWFHPVCPRIFQQISYEKIQQQILGFFGQVRSQLWTVDLLGYIHHHELDGIKRISLMQVIFSRQGPLSDIDLHGEVKQPHEFVVGLEDWELGILGIYI